MLALWMKLRKTHTVVASPLAGEMSEGQRGFIKEMSIERALLNKYFLL